MNHARWLVLGSLLLSGCGRPASVARSPAPSAPAPLPVEWRRPIDRPVISLGQPGEFDSDHVFAPCVMRHGRGGRGFRMFYPGSGPQPRRWFTIGIADSDDGFTWTKHAGNPVLKWDDQLTSLVTPVLLRGLHGEVVREQGRLRMYLIAVDFNTKEMIHRLYETTSGDDGLTWSPLSGPLMQDMYAPSVLKIDGQYRMWYTDVSKEPWCIRLARSGDGTHWTSVQDEPVLRVDQAWESRNLHYPYVLYEGDRYLMWYGSYWSARKETTALGLAVSSDGIHWAKHEGNPVVRPDPDRDFESNFCTSETVLPLYREARNVWGSRSWSRISGAYQIWYGTRNREVRKYKYFAIGTAVSRTGIQGEQ